MTGVLTTSTTGKMLTVLAYVRCRLSARDFHLCDADAVSVATYEFLDRSRFLARIYQIISLATMTTRRDRSDFPSHRVVFAWLSLFDLNFVLCEGTE